MDLSSKYTRYDTIRYDIIIQYNTVHIRMDHECIIMIFIPFWSLPWIRESLFSILLVLLFLNCHLQRPLYELFVNYNVMKTPHQSHLWQLKRTINNITKSRSWFLFLFRGHSHKRKLFIPISGKIIIFLEFRPGSEFWICRKKNWKLII